MGLIGLGKECRRESDFDQDIHCAAISPDSFLRIAELQMKLLHFRAMAVFVLGGQIFRPFNYDQQASSEVLDNIKLYIYLRNGFLRDLLPSITGWSVAK